MKHKMFFLIALISAPYAAATEREINLDCENQATQLIEYLSQAGLLVEGGESQAKSVSLKICSGAEQSAQLQHEEGKKKAIANWFFENTGGKKGNDRLKKKR